MIAEFLGNATEVDPWDEPKLSVKTGAEVLVFRTLAVMPAIVLDLREVA